MPLNHIKITGVKGAESALWSLTWLSGLVFLLLLQSSSMLQDMSSEHHFTEIFSRVFVSIALLMSIVWAYHQYEIDRFQGLKFPLEDGLPFYLVLTFLSLSLYENNWDLDFRESFPGMIAAGVPLLPLLLIPMVWYGMRDDNAGWKFSGQEEKGVLLALLGLGLMALSQVFDFYHDHHNQGSGLLRELIDIKGLEECLEYWALLAILQSFFYLALRRDVLVRSLVHGRHWHGLVGMVVLFSVGNAMVLGSQWDGSWLYFHILGMMVMVIGLVLVFHRLRVFLEETKVREETDELEKELENK